MGEALPVGGSVSLSRSLPPLSLELPAFHPLDFDPGQSSRPRLSIDMYTGCPPASISPSRTSQSRGASQMSSQATGDSEAVAWDAYQSAICWGSCKEVRETSHDTLIEAQTVPHPSQGHQVEGPGSASLSLAQVKRVKGNIRGAKYGQSGESEGAQCGDALNPPGHPRLGLPFGYFHPHFTPSVPPYIGPPHLGLTVGIRGALTLQSRPPCPPIRVCLRRGLTLPCLAPSATRSPLPLTPSACSLLLSHFPTLRSSGRGRSGTHHPTCQPVQSPVWAPPAHLLRQWEEREDGTTRRHISH